MNHLNVITKSAIVLLLMFLANNTLAFGFTVNNPVFAPVATLPAVTQPSSIVDCIMSDHEEVVSSITNGADPNLNQAQGLVDENGNLIATPSCDTLDALPRYEINAAKRQLTPPARNAYDVEHYFIELPSAAKASVSVLPKGLTWSQYNNFIEIKGRYAADVRTTKFSISQSGIGYGILQVINPGLHRCDRWGLSLDFSLDENVDLELCASGPKQTLVWRYLPDNIHNQLPKGLALRLPTYLTLGGTSALAGGSDARSALSGAIMPDAISASGIIVLESATGQTLLAKPVVFKVAPYFYPDIRIEKTSQQLWSFKIRMEIEKYSQQFSLVLPRFGGADGDLPSFIWRDQERLAQGLTLTKNNAGQWMIQGVVEQPVLLGDQDITLRLSVGGHRYAYLRIPVTIKPRFIDNLAVWTQNTQLRPEDLISTQTYAVLTGALVSPFTAAAAVALMAASSEADLIYDAKVQNTDEDNAERTGNIAELIGEYDIINLQEVFDNASRQTLLEKMAADYLAASGPAGSSLSITPPELPRASSGLLTAVSRSLSSRQSVISSPVKFNTCAGEFEDCMANKGFVYTRVQIGNSSGQILHVINTHTQADPNIPGQHAAVRRAQLHQIRDFIGQLDSSFPVLVTGDFNIVGDVIGEYNDLIANLGGNFVDQYRDEYPDDQAYPGLTIDATANVYTKLWSEGSEPQRLDYMLVRQGAVFSLLRRNIEVTDDCAPQGDCGTSLCEDHELELAPYTSLRCYLADHFGVKAEYDFVQH